MAKKNSSKVLNLTVWLTGVIVSLAVGFGMVGDGALNGGIPLLSGLANGAVVAFFGWIVIITTIVGVVLAIINK